MFIDMKHTYTQEQEEKIVQMLLDLLSEHKCFGIDSIDFMCDLADIKDVTDRDITEE